VIRTTYGRDHGAAAEGRVRLLAEGDELVAGTLVVLDGVVLGLEPVHAPRRRTETIVGNDSRVFTIVIPPSRFAP